MNSKERSPRKSGKDGKGFRKLKFPADFGKRGKRKSVY